MIKSARQFVEDFLPYNRVGFADFEASSFPTRAKKEGPGVFSYPVQIGIAQFNANSETFASCIRPTEKWEKRGFWDVQSEKIHGLSRQQLASAPKACDVVSSLNRFLESNEIEVLIGDHEFDRDWWQTLISSVPKIAKPKVRFVTWSDIAYDLGGALLAQSVDLEVAVEAAMSFPARPPWLSKAHDALDDALYLRYAALKTFCRSYAAYRRSFRPAKA
ncbi:3'-5' exonuclease family protein [Acetobacter persici]|uniref:Uncharacterized protein n=1 Tax=Acetobacter persici TaxID=1076596 RepID=A0A1U9LJZ5_9PROT|nr:hypothetical protein [Acetobacter persici]AQT06669.1 hypothetical protein A0U91_16830 [Acetobacter persici]